MSESTSLLHNQALVTPSRRPLVIAHRGASGLAPENTLAAFKMAIELGADGVELDVQLTSDGQPVVIHDARVNRTTDGVGYVASLRLERLRNLDAGSWFARRLTGRPRLSLGVRRIPARKLLSFSGEPVPTLEDTLSLLAPTGLKRIYVELKGKPANRQALLEVVLSLLRQSGIENSVTLLSFDHTIVHTAKQMAGNVRTAATIPAGGRRLISTRSIIRSAENAGVDEIALHFGLATRRTIDALHHRGLSVSVWTVNSKIAMRRLAAREVDAIMTDFPNRLCDVLDEPPLRVVRFGRRRYGSR